MEDEPELTPAQAVDDWEEHVDDLPDVPPSFIQLHKYTRLFAVDVDGKPGHDQYVFLVPNGLCVVGLAPSHKVLKTIKSSIETSACVDSTRQQQEDSVVRMEECGEQEPVKQLTTSEPPSAQLSTLSQDSENYHDHDAGSLPAGGQQLCIDFDVGRRHPTANKYKHGKGGKHQQTYMDSRSHLCVVEAKGVESLQVRCVAGGRLMEVNKRLATEPNLLLHRPCREGYLAILFPAEAQTAALKRDLMSCEDYLVLRGLTEADIA